MLVLLFLLLVLDYPGITWFLLLLAEYLPLF